MFNWSYTTTPEGRGLRWAAIDGNIDSIPEHTGNMQPVFREDVDRLIFRITKKESYTSEAVELIASYSLWNNNNYTHEESGVPKEIDFARSKVFRCDDRVIQCTKSTRFVPQWNITQVPFIMFPAEKLRQLLEDYGERAPVGPDLEKAPALAAMIFSELADERQSLLGRTIK